jgi:hypothetical protein
MLKVKLTRIRSNHNFLRTSEIVGKTAHIPEVGEEFMLFAPPLETKIGFRTVRTTKIRECLYDKGARKFIFQTANSLYALQVLDDKDPLQYARVKFAK